MTDLKRADFKREIIWTCECHDCGWHIVIDVDPATLKDVYCDGCNTLFIFGEDEEKA